MQDSADTNPVCTRPPSSSADATGVRTPNHGRRTPTIGLRLPQPCRSAPQCADPDAAAATPAPGPRAASRPDAAAAGYAVRPAPAAQCTSVRMRSAQPPGAHCAAGNLWVRSRPLRCALLQGSGLPTAQPSAARTGRGSVEDLGLADGDGHRAGAGLPLARLHAPDGSDESRGGGGGHGVAGMGLVACARLWPLRDRFGPDPCRAQGKHGPFGRQHEQLLARCAVMQDERGAGAQYGAEQLRCALRFCLEGTLARRLGVALGPASSPGTAPSGGTGHGEGRCGLVGCGHD